MAEGEDGVVVPPPQHDNDAVAEDGAVAEKAGEDASSEDESDDEEESDDEPVESLIQGRDRRSTRANRYNSLLEQEAAAEDGDDDLALLFAEAEEEDIDFEDPDAADASDVQDDDSSTDDEDQGPAAGDDDLEGERQLKKEERAAQRAQKRKADKAFVKPPLAGRKRVKIDESANLTTSESTSAATPSAQSVADRKRKMSERISWLPSGAPARTSSRTLSVQNKARTMASMKENESRRIRQIAIMEAAQKRKDANKAKPMTQAERMAEAAETERINSQSLNKWEEMEKERVRKQKARLEAMQNRKIDGPYVRWYSARGEWIGGKLKKVGKHPVTEAMESKFTKDGEPKKRPYTKRIRPQEGDDSTARSKTQSKLLTKASTNPNEKNEAEMTGKEAQTDGNDTSVLEPSADDGQTDREGPSIYEQSELFKTGDDPQSSGTKEEEASANMTEHRSDEDMTIEKDKVSEQEHGTSEPSNSEPLHLTSAHEPSQEDATNTEVQRQTHDQENVTMDDDAQVSEPTASESQIPPPNGTQDATRVAAGSTASTPRPTLDDITHDAHQDSTTACSALGDAQSKEDQAPTTVADTAHAMPTSESAPTPQVTEYSTYNNITLCNFDSTSIQDISVRRHFVMGTPLPTNFTLAAPSARPTAKAYHARHPKVTQSTCAITGNPARYRDPVTGLPYANKDGYKAIRKLIQGGCVWSNLLGAWCGGDGRILSSGGAARGVPDGFFTGVLAESTTGDAGATDAAVKTEVT